MKLRVKIAAVLMAAAGFAAAAPAAVSAMTGRSSVLRGKAIPRIMRRLKRSLKTREASR